MVEIWNKVSEIKPPEGEEVDTMSENGQQQRLKHKNNLWWFADMSMYVYYTPEFWRFIKSK